MSEQSIERSYLSAMRQVNQTQAESEMLRLMLKANRRGFMDLTRWVKEHPPNYDRACLCKKCQGD